MLVESMISLWYRPQWRHLIIRCGNTGQGKQHDPPPNLFNYRHAIVANTPFTSTNLKINRKFFSRARARAHSSQTKTRTAMTPEKTDGSIVRKSTNGSVAQVLPRTTTRGAYCGAYRAGSFTLVFGC